MSNMKEIQKLLELGENFHMCDVDNVSEDGIHLESWDEDVSIKEFQEIINLIYKDGYDISEFELLEIPHPKVFCFGNLEKNQYFDVVKFWDNKWSFSYCEDSSNKLANSIEEAIAKYEID